MRSALVIELLNEERKTLEGRSRGRSTQMRLVLRARIVLAAAAGLRNEEIAADLETSKKTVSLWRAGFASDRAAGIENVAPRPGRNPRRAFAGHGCSA